MTTVNTRGNWWGSFIDSVIGMTSPIPSNEKTAVLKRHPDISIHPKAQMGRKLTRSREGNLWDWIVWYLLILHLLTLWFRSKRYRPIQTEWMHPPQERFRIVFECSESLPELIQIGMRFRKEDYAQCDVDRDSRRKTTTWPKIRTGKGMRVAHFVTAITKAWTFWAWIIVQSGRQQTYAVEKEGRRTTHDKNGVRSNKSNLEGKCGRVRNPKWVGRIWEDAPETKRWRIESLTSYIYRTIFHQYLRNFRELPNEFWRAEGMNINWSSQWTSRRRLRKPFHRCRSCDGCCSWSVRTREEELTPLTLCPKTILRFLQMTSTA